MPSARIFQVFTTTYPSGRKQLNQAELYRRRKIAPSLFCEKCVRLLAG
jgi:hypothetical protein